MPLVLLSPQNLAFCADKIEIPFEPTKNGSEFFKRRSIDYARLDLCEHLFYDKRIASIETSTVK